MKKILKKLLFKYRLEKSRVWAINEEKPNMKKFKTDKLTTSELKAVENVWGNIAGMKVYPIFYEIFKTAESFNPYFLSDDLYFPYILRSLNPLYSSKTFANKGNLSIMFKDVQQPQTIVLGVRGILYNDRMEPLALEEAVKELSKTDKFLIKPIKDSSMGHGVKIVNANDDIYKVLKEYNTDFIAQYVVRQSSKTAKFNKTSLNTFRISTLNLNGSVSICTIMFKCGQNGACVDNGAAGGLMVGVEENGAFRDYAYDKYYNKHYSTKDGVVFKGVVIDEVKDLCNEVIEIHRKHLPEIAFVGWDIALDENDKLVLIEANMAFPGIQLEQLSAGKPIFGNRTEEVVNFVKNNPPLHIT